MALYAGIASLVEGTHEPEEEHRCSIKELRCPRISVREGPGIDQVEYRRDDPLGFLKQDRKPDKALTRARTKSRSPGKLQGTKAQLAGDANGGRVFAGKNDNGRSATRARSKSGSKCKSRPADRKSPKKSKSGKSKAAKDPAGAIRGQAREKAKQNPKAKNQALRPPAWEPNQPIPNKHGNAGAVHKGKNKRQKVTDQLVLEQYSDSGDEEVEDDALLYPGVLVAGKASSLKVPKTVAQQSKAARAAEHGGAAPAAGTTTDEDIVMEISDMDMQMGSFCSLSSKMNPFPSGNKAAQGQSSLLPSSAQLHTGCAASSSTCSNALLVSSAASCSSSQSSAFVGSHSCDANRVDFYESDQNSLLPSSGSSAMCMSAPPVPPCSAQASLPKEGAGGKRYDGTTGALSFSSSCSSSASSSSSSSSSASSFSAFKKMNKNAGFDLSEGSFGELVLGGRQPPPPPRQASPPAPGPFSSFATSSAGSSSCAEDQHQALLAADDNIQHQEGGNRGFLAAKLGREDGMGAQDVEEELQDKNPQVVRALGLGAGPLDGEEVDDLKDFLAQDALTTVNYLETAIDDLMLKGDGARYFFSAEGKTAASLCLLHVVDDLVKAQRAMTLLNWHIHALTSLKVDKKYVEQCRWKLKEHGEWIPFEIRTSAAPEDSGDDDMLADSSSSSSSSDAEGRNGRAQMRGPQEKWVTLAGLDFPDAEANRLKDAYRAAPTVLKALQVPNPDGLLKWLDYREFLERTASHVKADLLTLMQVLQPHLREVFGPVIEKQMSRLDLQFEGATFYHKRLFPGRPAFNPINQTYETIPVPHGCYIFQKAGCCMICGRSRNIPKQPICVPGLPDGWIVCCDKDKEKFQFPGRDACWEIAVALGRKCGAPAGLMNMMQKIFYSGKQIYERLHTKATAYMYDLRVVVPGKVFALAYDPQRKAPDNKTRKKGQRTLKMPQHDDGGVSSSAAAGSSSAGSPDLVDEPLPGHDPLVPAVPVAPNAEDKNMDEDHQEDHDHVHAQQEEQPKDPAPEGFGVGQEVNNAAGAGDQQRERNDPVVVAAAAAPPALLVQDRGPPAEPQIVAFIKVETHLDSYEDGTGDSPGLQNEIDMMHRLALPASHDQRNETEAELETRKANWHFVSFSKYQDLFRQEIQAYARADNKLLILFMDYDGVDLRDLSAGSKEEFPDADRQLAVRQLTSALLHLHSDEVNIIHLDLHSKNTLWDARRRKATMIDMEFAFDAAFELRLNRVPVSYPMLSRVQADNLQTAIRNGTWYGYDNGELVLTTEEGRAHDVQTFRCAAAEILGLVRAEGADPESIAFHVQQLPSSPYFPGEDLTFTN
ncbi:unnamed protein product [Amoebophrya sp. A120]|nr:unnamed protein product [Amoebophrya sp. A120]|eukprot:GSA120T00000397001.1